MVHAVLTILFDFFIIGSAVAIGAAMFSEYLAAREPHVGSTRRHLARHVTSPRAVSRPRMQRLPAQRRRAA